MVAPMVLDIRTFEARPGLRAELERLLRVEALPMLRRWKQDIVYCGPSLHDESSFVLMRAYGSVVARDREQAAFYGSEEWHKGPREAVRACIGTLISVVLELPEATIDALRRE
jgi:hypothetical protein